jgi:hypothetical protein
MDEVQIKEISNSSFYKTQECNGGSYNVNKWKDNQTEVIKFC